MKFRALRERMVAEELAGRDITDPRVLEAFRRVPRERFVPGDMRDLAYADEPLPIGEQQTISQPYIVALMTQAIGPCPGMRVLEVGTGSGFQAAILAACGCEVFTIERSSGLSREAAERLRRLGFQVHTTWGDGTQGWREQAPYDAIIVTAAARTIPEPYHEQLVEGGVCVIPVGASFQELLRLTKTTKGWRSEKLCDVLFVRLTPQEPNLS